MENSKAKLKDELSELTHTRIMQAAAALFAANGFHNVSLDQIAKEIGMSKMVIYSRFGDKNNLLFAICKRGVELTYAALQSVQDMQIEDQQKLESFFALILDIVLEHRTFLSVYSRESVNLSDVQYSEILSLRVEIDNKVAGWLSSLHSDTQAEVINPEITATAVNFMLSTVWVWFQDDSQKAREEHVLTMLALAKRMVGLPN